MKESRRSKNKIFYCPRCKRVWQFNYLNQYKPIEYMDSNFPKRQVIKICRNCKPKNKRRRFFPIKGIEI